ncbi:hypothetical protein [Microvirga pudoricolor]|uniref:hypothetical protein n=1 Tax=Microvirga pudoricolor TaxID=2778729 RepID=UPI0019527B7A|nr:hypothetical protein [Microvirga pudoricolor]MBM6595095.1 hypothetical protein [Microvirga pudoricolor]
MLPSPEKPTLATHWGTYHEMITALPANPWMHDIVVHPLAKHPVDPTTFTVS